MTNSIFVSMLPLPSIKTERKKENDRIAEIACMLPENRPMFNERWQEYLKQHIGG